MNIAAINPSTQDLLSCENVKKNVLPHYGINKCVVTQVKFKDTDKQRAIYKVETPTQNYCLKKVYYPIDELLFVYSVMEWLFRYGIKVPRILSTSDHGRYVIYEDMLFILTKWIQGDKCDFDNIEHINLSSKNLGKMHDITKGFLPILGSANKEGYSNLAQSFEKHKNQMMDNEKLALKYDDYFSKLYIISYTTSMSLASLSTNIANSIDFDNLTKAVCHNDYVSKNLIIDNNNVCVIDFDKCKYDYCALDIGYCLRRLLRRDNTRWNLDLAINFLQQYELSNSLTIDDYKYILAYLAFPQKYWKLSRDYYKNISKCNKKAFVNLFTKAVNYDKEHKEFTYNFLKYIEYKFDTSIL